MLSRSDIAINSRRNGSSLGFLGFLIHRRGSLCDSGAATVSGRGRNQLGSGSGRGRGSGSCGAVPHKMVLATASLAAATARVQAVSILWAVPSDVALAGADETGGKRQATTHFGLGALIEPMARRTAIVAHGPSCCNLCRSTLTRDHASVAIRTGGKRVTAATATEAHQFARQLLAVIAYGARGALCTAVFRAPTDPAGIVGLGWMCSMAATPARTSATATVTATATMGAPESSASGTKR